MLAEKKAYTKTTWVEIATECDVVKRRKCEFCKIASLALSAGKASLSGISCDFCGQSLALSSIYVTRKTHIETYKRSKK